MHLDAETLWYFHLYEAIERTQCCVLHLEGMDWTVGRLLCTVWKSE